MSHTPLVTIIDDDASVRVATESLVRSLGLLTRCFASAEDFLSCPDLDETDCVITDLQMPGLSGLELQTLLRERGHRIPLIMITAFPEDRIREQAMAAGAIGFLAKPFDGQSMVACLDTALEDFSF